MRNRDAMVKVFGKTTGVVIPVVHHKDWPSVERSIETAIESGADGACLIAQGVSWSELLREYPRLRARYPARFPLGLNPLGGFHTHGLGDFYWTDDPVPVRGVTDGKPWFAGAAFKTMGNIFPDAYPAHVDAVYDRRATLPVTSGSATGQPAPVEKVRLIRGCVDAIAPCYGFHPMLGLASGITPENAAEYLGLVDVWIVASGIEEEFGVLNRDRTARLVSIVHGHKGGR